MSQDLESEHAERTASAVKEHLRTDHLLVALGGRTARGALVTVASHGLKFSLSIVATAILARLLTPQDYGLIGMVGVATNFVSMFKDLGLSFATIQRAEINYDQISTLFWVNVTLSVLIMILMIAIAPSLAWFYGEPRLTMIAMVTATGFIFGGLAVQHEALLRRQMRFFALSAIALTSMVMSYITGIALAWHGARYWALVSSQLVLLASNAAGVWFLCNWWPGPPRRNSGVRSMLTFGGNITGYAVVNYFSKNTDNLLIGRFWGAQTLGLYNKAAQLLGLPTDQIDEPLASVAIPALSRLADSSERYRQAYLRILEKVIMLTMPAVTLMMATSDWLVLLVLGPQWGQTSRIFLFMGIAGLFQPVVNTVGWLFITQGRARHMLQWSMISAPISVLSIAAGLSWGAAGVAVSYSLTKLLIINPLLYWFVGRSGPVRTGDLYRVMGPFALASVCALLACGVFRMLLFIRSPLAGVAASAAITGITTFIVLALIPAGKLALIDVKQLLVQLKSVKESATLQK